MDVLADLLQRSRARGAAFSHSTVYGDWGLAFPESAGLGVHAVVSGQPFLWTDDAGDAIPLGPGDIVLVRGTVAHQMANRAGATCRPLAAYMRDSAVPGSSRRFMSGDPADGAPAVFFCGAYLFEGDLADGLLSALPERLAIHPPAGSGLRTTIDLLALEMQEDEAGQQTMLDRLLDIALVQIIREYFNDPGVDAPPWFVAQRDPVIGGALRALHAEPGRRWTVADLAAEALMSRAAFARRFTELLGTSPLAYLTDWRMALARERLRDGSDGLAAIAGELGYSSEFSFAAAFKKQHGVAPGRWRSAQRERRAA